MTSAAPIQPDTRAIPRGKRLKRAMAWMRAWMARAPLAMVVAPGTRTVRLSAMDRRTRP